MYYNKLRKFIIIFVCIASLKMIGCQHYSSGSSHSNQNENLNNPSHKVIKSSQEKNANNLSKQKINRSQQRQGQSYKDEDMMKLSNELQRMSLEENAQNLPKKKVKVTQNQEQDQSSQQYQQSSSVIARKIYMYSIPMDSIGSAIAKKSVKRYIKHEYPLTITLYKCKLESLSAYNYTLAWHLVNIINMQFPFTMVQLVPLEDINDNDSSYQVVYRFDLYDPENISSPVSEIGFSTQMGSNIGLTDISSEMPLLELLQSQYEDFNFDQFISEYRAAKEQNKKCRTSPLDMFKDSLEKTTAHINIEQRKFQLKLEEKDTKFYELIAIFQTNLALNMFIRSYRLEHDFEAIGKDFIFYMKDLLKKHPHAIYE